MAQDFSKRINKQQGQLAPPYTFDEVAGVQGDKKVATWNWTVGFSDGTASSFTTAKNQNNKGFHELLAQRAGHPV